MLKKIIFIGVTLGVVLYCVPYFLNEAAGSDEHLQKV